jgi:hypothetical protein
MGHSTPSRERRGILPRFVNSTKEELPAGSTDPSSASRAYQFGGLDTPGSANTGEHLFRAGMDRSNSPIVHLLKDLLHESSTP